MSSRLQDARDVEESMGGASEFVKKLYNMLNDSAYSKLVSWGPHGDYFVVLDQNEFQDIVLPKLFKHQNFSSFVRQLNKYDFHKIKNSDDVGPRAWTFQHKNFNANKVDALESIKRKAPHPRKSGSRSTTRKESMPASPSASPPVETSSAAPSADTSAASHSSLQAQIDRLRWSHETMSRHLTEVESNYRTLLSEMVDFQRTMAMQDALLKELIQPFVINGQQGLRGVTPMMSRIPGADQAENLIRMHESRPTVDPRCAPLCVPPTPSAALKAGGDSGPLLADARQVSLPPPRYPSQIEVSHEGDANICLPELPPPFEAPSHLPSAQLPRHPPSFDKPGTSLGLFASPNPVQEALERRNEEANRRRPSGSHSVGSLDTSAAPPFKPEALLTSSPVEVIDTQDEIDAMDENQSVMPSLPNVRRNSDIGAPDLAITTHTQVPTPGVPSNAPSVTRKPSVPGWTFPPRVLVVEDDAVSRKLSSKYLQIAGCTVDVAVDGVGAVNKCIANKYHMVLMDVLMPNLDGVSAAEMIRKFDTFTPIITMTSNVSSEDVKRYLKHGMNGVLAKPFNRATLQCTLEEHLRHLKALAESLSRAPTPRLDKSFTNGIARPTGGTSSSLMHQPAPLPYHPHAFDSHRAAFSISSSSTDLDMSDEQFAAILSSIVTNDYHVDPGLDPASGPAAPPSSSLKRGLEDGNTERASKRSRFEEVTE